MGAGLPQVTGAATAEGAVSAWLFLKRDPGYIVGWWQAACGRPRATGEPFPIREQTEADLDAAAWGLLAWEDPLADDGAASPFWTDAPMTEGMPGRPGMPSFASLVREQGGRLEGLRLLDGALILKIERGRAAGQVRIEDGDAFDPEGGLGLYLGYGLDHLSLPLRRAGDLRAVVAGELPAEGVPSPGMSRASFCSPSTAV